MHVGRRVYVSNLAWRTSWQDLKDKCVSAGPTCLVYGLQAGGAPAGCFSAGVTPFGSQSAEAVGCRGVPMLACVWMTPCPQVPRVRQRCLLQRDQGRGW